MTGPSENEIAPPDSEGSRPWSRGDTIYTASLAVTYLGFALLLVLVLYIGRSYIFLVPVSLIVAGIFVSSCFSTRRNINVPITFLVFGIVGLLFISEDVGFPVVAKVVVTLLAVLSTVISSIFLGRAIRSSQSLDSLPIASLPDEDELPDENDYLLDVGPLSNESEELLEDFIGKKRESTRAFLAQLLIAIFAGSVLLSFIMLGLVMFHGLEGESDFQNYTKDIVTLLLTSQSGVLGAAIGFYFGSNSESQQKKQKTSSEDNE